MDGGIEFFLNIKIIKKSGFKKNQRVGDKNRLSKKCLKRNTKTISGCKNKLKININ